ncbi:MAG: cytochrome c [Bacteroidetes bacterium]|nr:cytochrome c [Bacteroidota bacterium]
MNMRNTYFLLLITAVFVVSSCSYSRHPDSPLYNPNNAGFEYAPAMYHSWPYEPLSQVTDPEATSWYKNSMPHNDYNGAVNSNVLTPVAGTIARGKLGYYEEFDPSDAGREQASAQLKNPIELNDFTLMEGKRLYNLYCDHCHNETGGGQTKLADVGFAPQAYYTGLKDRTEGSIYHTILYGKGAMGPHASQLSPDQRWKIVHWVKTLQLSDKAYEVTTVAERNALASPSTEPIQTETIGDNSDADSAGNVEVIIEEEPTENAEHGDASHG